MQKKIVFGKKYHIQMTVDFLRNAIKFNWKTVRPFVSVKNKKEALSALASMEEEGYEIMPCSCKKTARDGQCLGFS